MVRLLPTPSSPQRQAVVVMMARILMVVIPLWSIFTVVATGATGSNSAVPDPYSFRTASVSSRIRDPILQTQVVTEPTIEESKPAPRSRQGRKIRNGSSKTNSAARNTKKSTRRRVARPAKMRTTTKKTTFAELMSETQLQKSVHSKPISNSHAIPTYQFKPVTSRREGYEGVRLERPPVTTSVAAVAPVTNAHHFSIIASKYITKTPVMPTPLSRILSTLVPLQSTFTRAAYTHSTLQPTQTISLPPLTAMLFAESVPDSPNPDYGNSVAGSRSNSRTVNFASVPLASSKSRSSSRVTTIEPYMLPDDFDITTITTKKTSPKSSRTSSKKTTSSNDSDVYPSKKRSVRHNAQNPYSYRELHGSAPARTGSRDPTRATASSDREDTRASSRDSSSREPARGGLGKQHIPAHLPQSSNVYIDPFEDMYDSSTYSIAASEHYFDRYTDENNDDFDDDNVFDASGRRPLYPYTGSGTRSLYTEPLIQNRPKVKEEEKKGSNSFGRQTKTMFSSQSNKNFNDKKSSDDNQKKLMMMMAMLKKNEENKNKMRNNNGNNNKKKEDDMAKMMAAGGDMVMGNLLPEDPKDEMPKIQALDVVCTKEMMNVSLQFDKDFGGVIYSKGHFGQKECTYVENDKKKDFNFTVPGPEMCGTKSVTLKDKPEFLENILIVQNEPGIQEVWDSARGIRCVFDGQGGDVTQKVTAALSVAKIDQQVVSFSADTQATATLDIQVGRGPFAPSAAGLVKIGELMTLVVTVEGPEEANLLVRQCMASDGAKNNTIMLTDMNGCVVKKKLMGSWQTTKNTGDKKKPVIAFAHFQAFKFPDQMEVMIECQVDLCSGDCGVCQEDMMKTMEKMTAGRRRRRALPHLLYSATANEDGGDDPKQDGVDATTESNTVLEAVDLTEEIEYLMHPGHKRYTLYQDTTIDTTKSIHGSTENNVSLNGSTESSTDQLIETVISVHNVQVTNDGKRARTSDTSDNNGTENLNGTESSKGDYQHGSGGEGTVEFLGTAGGVLKAANLGHIDLYHRSSDRIEFAQPLTAADTGLKAEVNENVAHLSNDEGNNRIDGVLRVANKLQVLSPEDISKHDDIRDISSIYKRDPTKEATVPSCISLTQVAASVGLVLSLVAVIVLLAACLRNRSAGKNISTLPEEHTFHAFSSVTLR